MNAHPSAVDIGIGIGEGERRSKNTLDCPPTLKLLSAPSGPALSEFGDSPVNKQERERGPRGQQEEHQIEKNL